MCWKFSNSKAGAAASQFSHHLPEMGSRAWLCPSSTGGSGPGSWPCLHRPAAGPRPRVQPSSDWAKAWNSHCKHLRTNSLLLLPLLPLKPCQGQRRRRLGQCQAGQEPLGEALQMLLWEESQEDMEKMKEGPSPSRPHRTGPALVTMAPVGPFLIPGAFVSL